MTTGILADELENAAADGGRAHVVAEYRLMDFCFCVYAGNGSARIESDW
jgi:hypothetical protein